MLQSDNYSILLNKIYDCTVVTNIMKADGIGRQGLGLIGSLKNDIKFNVIKMQPYMTKDIDSSLMQILSRSTITQGNVTFWTYILGLNAEICNLHRQITSYLKIAYSMFESSAIPTLWVSILNSYFDCVVVPDLWLVEVYKKSGVTIPIFVLPLGIWLEDFLKQPIKTQRNKVFTFGMSAGFWERKNHLKVLKAFQQSDYANNPNYKLKLHGRFGPYKNQVELAVQQSNLNNVELLSVPLSEQDYLNFMKSLDCYVFVSKGEGFSITPREALALGIPVILSDNTVHQTIIRSGYVNSVPARHQIPAVYEVFGNQQIGDFYDCEASWVTSQMEEVEKDYDYYMKDEDRQLGREWTQQYLWSSLKKRYLQLLKPTKAVLSNQNWIGETKIETDDPKLFKKLQILQDFYS